MINLPFLKDVRARIARQGNWSRSALFPVTHKRERQKRVWIITRDDRNFAVVANNLIEAATRLTILLP